MENPSLWQVPAADTVRADRVCLPFCRGYSLGKARRREAALGSAKICGTSPGSGLLSLTANPEHASLRKRRKKAGTPEPCRLSQWCKLLCRVFRSEKSAPRMEFELATIGLIGQPSLASLSPEGGPPGRGTELVVDDSPGRRKIAIGVHSACVASCGLGGWRAEPGREPISTVEGGNP
jgi:hypothetical protein